MTARRTRCRTRRRSSASRSCVPPPPACPSELLHGTHTHTHTHITHSTVFYSYTPRLKKVDRLHFWDNFGQSGPIFITFSLLNSEMICGGSFNLNYHLPSDLLPHYLAKCKRMSTIQHYSTVNSVQSGAKTFNYSKYSRSCYFLVCSYGLFYCRCLKCLPSSYIHALSGARHWSILIDGCVDVRCSVLR